MKPFLERLGGYCLQRLGEPTTWAGMFSIGTALLGWNVSPEKQAAVMTLGTTIVGMLLMAAREGRDKADNPTLPTTIKGEMPPQKSPIVAPAEPVGTVEIDPKHVPVDATGELHAPESKP